MRLSFIAAVFFLSTLISPPQLFGGGGSYVKADHWKRPFKTSAEFGAEVAPYPESCKACHRSQYDDWSGSLHSGSMSPGLLAQLDAHLRPGFASSCYFCHAPAIEQSEVVERSESNLQDESLATDDSFISNPVYDERLAISGVNCAVCHLRSGVINGPSEPSVLSGEAPHESIQAPVFSSAEFCAACHQMDRGFELNGKLLTNTYAEWKESYYGKNNITCQKCHMPGRRHRFRGIHDSEMVRGGLDINVLRVPTEKGIKAALTIKNARVGHMFPTYVTPIVVLKAYLLDANKEIIEDSIEKGFIGRLISQDLSIEYFDTRLKPFQTYTFTYDSEGREAGGAKKLVFEIIVRPDEFYDRLFKRAIEHGKSGFKDVELKEAERRTDASPYVLFTEELDIGQ